VVPPRGKLYFVPSGAEICSRPQAVNKASAESTASELFRGPRMYQCSKALFDSFGAPSTEVPLAGTVSGSQFAQGNFSPTGRLPECCGPVPEGLDARQLEDILQDCVRTTGTSISPKIGRRALDRALSQACRCASSGYSNLPYFVTDMALKSKPGSSDAANWGSRCSTGSNGALTNIKEVAQRRVVMFSILYNGS